MPWTSRGGTASSRHAVTTMAPSQESTRELWFATRRKAPDGRDSIPWHSTRKYFR